jgi:hypothetical protein
LQKKQEQAEKQKAQQPMVVQGMLAPVILLEITGVLFFFFFLLSLFFLEDCFCFTCLDIGTDVPLIGPSRNMNAVVPTGNIRLQYSVQQLKNNEALPNGVDPLKKEVSCLLLLSVVVVVYLFYFTIILFFSNVTQFCIC